MARFPTYKGKLSISRPSRGNGCNDSIISIRIRDKNSSIEFLEIDVEAVELMKALTGLSEVPMEYEARGLHNLGKYYQHRPFSMTVHEDTLKEAGVNIYGADELEIWAGKNAEVPEGWHLSRSLRSQGSKRYDFETKTLTLNMSIYRYTEEKENGA